MRARIHTRTRTHARARFYSAKITNMYSGVFELWNTGTDLNLDPSTDYIRYSGEHPCTMASTQHVFLPVPVADGGLPCTEPPPVETGEECIPTVAHPIFSGYVCSSVCAAGEMPASVYQCTNGQWPDTVECVDTTGTLLCTANDSTTVGAGVAGIAGCGALVALGTKCEVVCNDGWWGTGEITCSLSQTLAPPLQNGKDCKGNQYTGLAFPEECVV